MIKQYVEHESFASLVLLDRSLEKYPEPFRCQGDKVLFILSFKEYIEYLKKYSYLYENRETIHQLITMYRPGQNDAIITKKLFSIFMRDVSRAISKEIYFAEWQNRPCTYIIHEATGMLMASDDIDSFCSGISTTIHRQIFDELSEKGYKLSFPISERNMKFWKYAVFTYYFSQSETNPLWSYKI